MPPFLRRRYDDNLVGVMILAKLITQNIMIGVWKNRLNLAEFVRCQFGREYDGSAARYSALHQAETALRDADVGDRAGASERIKNG